MSKHRNRYSPFIERLSASLYDGPVGGKHARRPETMLVYIGWRRDGEVHGQVIRGEGDDAEIVDFIVEDNEPDDVWGPILSRIAEEVGLNGSPDHCDGGEIPGNRITVGVGVFEIRHDGTLS